MAVEQSLTVNPSGVDITSGHYSYATASNTANAYTDTSSTTYARMSLKTGVNAESYRFFTFSLSDIPENAIINSVTCEVKASITQIQSGYISSKTLQLYSGIDTAKGTATEINSTSAKIYTLNVGDWTASELQDCRLRIYAKRNNMYTTRSYYLDLYGANLTVNYTIDDEEHITKLYVKENGNWSEYSKVYKKVNGVWIEQNTLDDLFDTTTKYIRNTV